MSVMKVKTGDFSLYSTWSCKVRNGKWIIDKGPSVSQKTVSFQYSLPSGNSIKSSKIVASFGYPLGGISAIKVNGTMMSRQSDGTFAASVRLGSTSGTFSATFCFQSSGKIYNDHSNHTSYLSLKNVYLEINYKDFSGNEDAGGGYSLKGFAVPPQSVCIYDEKNNAIYTFDGVLKIQHNLSMDLQEEPEAKKKEKYVNNAKNEPDKLSLDVVMSDVYSVGGTDFDMEGFISSAQENVLANAGKAVMVEETRSSVMFAALHWLKEQRNKLSVITPQYVYTEMILDSVTVNQDDTCPYGWNGQITFQHAFEPKKEKAEATTGGKETDGVPTPSFISQIISGITGGFF